MMKPHELFGSKLRFDDKPREVEDTVAHLKDLQLQKDHIVLDLFSNLRWERFSGYLVTFRINGDSMRAIYSKQNW